MARRRKAQKRDTVPDKVFNSKLVTKFINYIMLDGKKNLAEKIFYDAIEQSAKMTGQKDQLEMFNKVMDNARPMIEVKSRRVGGATYHVPVEVQPHRQDALAIRWIIGYARAKKGTPMSKALAQEFSDTFSEQGNTIKKRDDTHRMAEANRAFAHFRW